MRVKNKMFFAILIAMILLAITIPAFADGTDYDTNPGFPHASECGQAHGAFQYFEGTQASWIPDAAQNGGIGDTTGPANKNACH